MFELKNNLCEKWDCEWAKYGKIRILILGSIPGLISNRNLFYYSSGRQIIWELLSEMLNEDFERLLNERKYVEIVKLMSKHGVALSDIYSYADKTAENSNDSTLIKKSLVRNENLLNYLNSNDLVYILFNGKYEKRFISEFKDEYEMENIKLIELPSLSRANTHLSISEKRNEWLGILNKILKC